MALLEREISQNPLKWKITIDAYNALHRAYMFPPEMHTDLIDGEIYESNQGMPKPWKISRDAYYALDRAGFFAPDRRVELIDGEIFKRMSPIGAEHIYAVNTLREMLHDRLKATCTINSDSSLIISDSSEPEPDIIVLRGPRSKYARVKATSRDVELVIEVSASTLRFDQQSKVFLYSNANIPEYWIVNLNDRCVEVYREPQKNGVYGNRRLFDENAVLTPLVQPDAQLPVADFLP